jgi:glycosyltransferase involved in cell wall biosynthesis
VKVLFLIFIGAAAIHFIRYGIVFLRFTYFKTEDDPLNFSDQPVSVLVCAKNELENLKNLLPKLLKQAYSHYEIIIVDDRSDDGSYEFLKEEKERSENLKLVRIDFVPDHIHPKKYAITLGIKAASHDLVLLTDADCEPATIHWIGSMTRQFKEDTNFVLGFSNYKKARGMLNKLIRYETLLTGSLYLSAAMGGNPYMGIGRNLGYRKSFFLSVKGFHKDGKAVGGDDDLLVNRHARGKDTRLMIGEQGLVYSVPKKNWKDFFIQKKRHLSAGKRYKFKDKFLLSSFYLSKIVFWLFGVMLILLKIHLLETGIAVLVTSILIYLTYFTVCRKTGIKFDEKVWILPMDILFIMYISVIGSVALFSKRIRWS